MLGVGKPRNYIVVCLVNAHAIAIPTLFFISPPSALTPLPPTMLFHQHHCYATYCPAVVIVTTTTTGTKPLPLLLFYITTTTTTTTTITTATTGQVVKRYNKFCSRGVLIFLF